MADSLPADFVQRPEEFEALVRLLLAQNRESPVAITAALRGAGGYGKTTLAAAVCHDQRVRNTFKDGILWATLGESASQLTLNSSATATSCWSLTMCGISTTRARLCKAARVALV